MIFEHPSKKVQLLIIFPWVLSRILSHVLRGVKKGRKTEKMGLLFGKVVRRGRLLVIKNFPYKGGLRSSTGCEYDPELLDKRIRELEEKSGLKYLGLYHSHVEHRGGFYFGLSRTDSREFLHDKHSIIEVVAGVRKGGSTPTHYKGKRLLRMREGFKIIITAYSKEGGRVYQVPVREAVHIVR